MFKGRGLFPRVILGCLLLSLLSEVNRVIEDFCADADILLLKGAYLLLEVCGSCTDLVLL